MNNIPIEVEALSCLLPLLALMILAVQFCRVSGFMSGLPLVYTIQDKFSSSYEGLISINNESNLQINEKSCSTFDQNNTPKLCRSSKDHSNFQLDHLRKERNLDLNNNFLLGCKIGLSKMNRINKAYFQTNLKGINNYSSKKIKVRKIIKRNVLFESTQLSIIVEGLQY